MKSILKIIIGWALLFGHCSSNSNLFFENKNSHGSLVGFQFNQDLLYDKTHTHTFIYEN